MNYNFPGWSVGEFKAFNEIFSEDEYKIIAFSKHGGKLYRNYRFDSYRNKIFQLLNSMHEVKCISSMKDVFVAF